MIIQRFCHEGLIGEANELFAEMEASDYLADDRTYNTHVHNCSNNEKFNEAGVLMTCMTVNFQQMQFPPWCYWTCLYSKNMILLNLFVYKFLT